MPNTPPVLAIAERLMNQPAAPCHEEAVKAEIRQIAEENGLGLAEDEFGNLLVTLNTNPGVRPLVLAAHLDHPGFIVRQRLSGETWLVEFKGGVGDGWFTPGTPLLLMPGRTPAILGKRTTEHRREFEVSAKSPPPEEPRFAVWDLPDFQVIGPLISGRACDDLIGAATVLAVIIELKQRNAQVHVIGALSRAEEVGFHGALCLAQSGRIAREALFISLETSRELPPARMGEGVIIRVGDKASIFNPEATRFLGEVAQDLQKDSRPVKWQRALMFGGTCEATAYQEFGYQTAAVCVALGNYHNCAEDNRIAAEYVNSNDVLDMVTLLAAAAEAMPRYSDLVGRLPRRLETYTAEALKALRSLS